MTKHVLDDDRMVRMYAGDYLMADIATHFEVDHNTIYRHLRKNKVCPNRRVSIAWTPHEEMQLIDAYRSGVTGQEYGDWVSTRTSVACKGHLRKLGM